MASDLKLNYSPLTCTGSTWGFLEQAEKHLADQHLVSNLLLCPQVSKHSGVLCASLMHCKHSYCSGALHSFPVFCSRPRRRRKRLPAQVQTCPWRLTCSQWQDGTWMEGRRGKPSSSWHLGMFWYVRSHLALLSFCFFNLPEQKGIQGKAFTSGNFAWAAVHPELAPSHCQGQL